MDLVDLDEVIWTDPPDREEAGSPNVVGAVALHAAFEAFSEIGWPAMIDHDRRHGVQAAGTGLASIPGVRLLGPGLERGDAAGRGIHRRRGVRMRSSLHDSPPRTRSE